MNKRKIKIRTPKEKLPVRSFYSLHRLRNIHPLISANIVSVLIGLSHVLASLVLLIGISVLVGWWIQNEILKSIFINLPGMKTNSAIAFIFAALSLLLLLRKNTNLFFRFLKNLFASVVFLIGLLTLFQYITQVNIGIDQLLFREDIGSQVVGSLNRMPPNTALLFLIIGINLLSIDKVWRDKPISQYLVITSGLILFPTIMGYFYGIDFIYGSATNTKIPLNTAVAFGLLLFAILFARPKLGFMRIVTSDSAGGYLTRRLTVAAVTIPLLMGWLILSGHRSGLYDTESRFLLLIITSTILFTAMIWRSAQSLHRIDTERHIFEQNLLFLAEASKILATSLDYNKTLTTVAFLAVPEIADWCAVEIIDKKGVLRQIALVHNDQKRIRLAKELRRVYPPSINALAGMGHVVRSQNAELIHHVSEKVIAKIAKDKRHYFLIQNLNIKSLMTVPIIVRKKSVGVLQFISSRPDRLYGETDLFMVKEVASRTALAIENAMLYRGAKDATKLRDEFISIASHELKTPVTSLKVYTQILQKQLIDNEKASSYLVRMNSQIDRLSILIKDLLDVSRIQVGKLVFQIEKFDADLLIQEIVDNLQLTTKHKIIIEGEARVPVNGDKDRIGQVLINLITNAIKYSPDADRVQIAITQENERVCIAVTDFGIGIDAAYLAKVFDKFYQVKDPKHRSFQGLGMGLYISREIVRRHGDDLKVTSKKGKGSTFTFGLPTVEK